MDSRNTRPANPRWRTAAILEKSINRDLRNGFTDLDDDMYWTPGSHRPSEFRVCEKPIWQTTITGSSLYLHNGRSSNDVDCFTRIRATRAISRKLCPVLSNHFRSGLAAMCGLVSNYLSFCSSNKMQNANLTDLGRLIRLHTSNKT